MTLQQLLDMPLHTHAIGGPGLHILRVPLGWLYSWADDCSVFVPEPPLHTLYWHPVPRKEQLDNLKEMNEP